MVESNNKKKIRDEKAIVEAMVTLYCKGNHNPGDLLCRDCDQLLKYSFLKLERCPFGEDKPACSKCSVHCYMPKMQKTIKKVMRYSGP